MLGELEDLACQRQRPGIQDKEQDLHQPQHSCPTQVGARICTWEGEGQPGVTPCPLPCTPCHGSSESNNPGIPFPEGKPAGHFPDGAITSLTPGGDQSLGSILGS